MPNTENKITFSRRSSQRAMGSEKLSTRNIQTRHQDRSLTSSQRKILKEPESYTLREPIQKLSSSRFSVKNP